MFGKKVSNLFIFLFFCMFAGQIYGMADDLVREEQYKETDEHIKIEQILDKLRIPTENAIKSVDALNKQINRDDIDKIMSKEFSLPIKTIAQSDLRELNEGRLVELFQYFRQQLKSIDSSKNFIIIGLKNNDRYLRNKAMGLFQDLVRNESFKIPREVVQDLLENNNDETDIYDIGLGLLRYLVRKGQCFKLAIQVAVQQKPKKLFGKARLRESALRLWRNLLEQNQGLDEVKKIQDEKLQEILKSCTTAASPASEIDESEGGNVQPE